MFVSRVWLLYCVCVMCMLRHTVGTGCMLRRSFAWHGLHYYKVQAYRNVRPLLPFHPVSLSTVGVENMSSLV